jgi:hypothetical protein
MGYGQLVLPLTIFTMNSQEQGRGAQIDLQFEGAGTARDTVVQVAIVHWHEEVGHDFYTFLFQQHK